MSIRRRREIDECWCLKKMSSLDFEVSKKRKWYRRSEVVGGWCLSCRSAFKRGLSTKMMSIKVVNLPLKAQSCLVMGRNAGHLVEEEKRKADGC